MKTYTKNLKIVKIERINSSCNGNPAYKMLVEDEKMITNIQKFIKKH